MPSATVRPTVPAPPSTTIAGLELVAPTNTLPPPTPTLSPTPLPTLAAGWNQLEPGGETACARGTPYAFWVRPGAANRLLIFFQGGGGCWDAVTCAPGSAYFDETVSAADDPSRLAGVFDFDNAANPFQDWTVVFIAYCTGDVHWGNHTQSYARVDGDPVVIQHKGFVNAGAALAWAYRYFPNPERVFVTGCSAGAVGSAVHSPYISEQYPEAVIAQLGDSLAFVFHRSVDLQANYRAHDNFPIGIPALENLPPGELTMSSFYAAIASAYPDQMFAQYTTRADRVQAQFFVAAGGRPDAFPAALAESLRQIHAEAPNFRSYLAPGDQHCILPYDRYYTTTVADVSFRDWTARLAQGEAVPNVRCEDCPAVAENP